MSIFDNKKEIKRIDLRQILRTSSPYIPGTGGKMYSKNDRIKMEAEIFPESRFKSHISNIECKRRMRELSKERFNARTSGEKINIDRKMKFLQQVTGIKPY